MSSDHLSVNKIDFFSGSEWAWKTLQLGVLLLPFIPSLGTVGLVLAMVSVWQNCYRQISRNPLNRILAVLGLWLVINSCLAEHKVEAFLGLANFLPFFALFAAFSVLIRQPFQLRRLAWLLVIPSLPIVILGLGQLFAQWSIPKFLGWELVPQGVPPGRMASVFIYANFLAVYLLVVTILGWGLWLITYQTWRKTKQQGSVLLLLTLIVVIDEIGLVLANSRSAWGISVIAGLAFAVYLGWWLLVWGMTGAATVILWAGIGPVWGRNWLRAIVPAYFWARLSDEIYERPVETLRITQWRFCWQLIQQRPLTGWGLRNFTPLYQEQTNFWFGHPHNLWLMLSAETGIVATLLLSGTVGWVMMQGIILVKNWSLIGSESNKMDSDRLIFFSYLVAFASYVLFNLSDVTIFDLRINTIGWLLLSAFSGIVFQQQAKLWSKGIGSES